MASYAVATDTETLVRTRDEARTAAAAARALQPREEQLGGLRRSVETYAARITLLQDELVQHETALTRLPAQVVEAREQHAAALAARAALAGAQAQAADLHKRVAASAQHAALVPQLADARAALAVAVDEVHLLTEQWLHLREQRLEGMAAEMAQTLVVGGGCPVCGSEHHPHPAQSGSSAIDAEAERVARKAVDDAEAGRLAREEHVRDLTTRIALAELLAGTGPGQVSDQLERADAEVARLQSLAESAEPTAARLRALEQEQDELTRRREAARLEKQGVVAAEQAGAVEIAAISAEIQAQLWDASRPRPRHPRRAAHAPWPRRATRRSPRPSGRRTRTTMPVAPSRRSPTRCARAASATRPRPRRRTSGRTSWTVSASRSAPTRRRGSRPARPSTTWRSSRPPPLPRRTSRPCGRWPTPAVTRPPRRAPRSASPASRHRASRVASTASSALPSTRGPRSRPTST